MKFVYTKITNLFNKYNHSFKNLILLYLSYISLIIICSYVFAILFSIKFNVMDNNNFIILDNISYEFGELISNLYNSKGYFHEVNGIKYYLQKLPAVPFLLLIISKISLNYYFVVISKNFIIFTIYFFLSYILLKDFKNKILFFFILLIPICIPYNFSVALNYVYEDNIIAIFLPLLFLSVISNSNYRFYIASLILFILYFTKTSMFLIVLILPFIILFFEKKTIFKIKIFPLLVSMIAIIIWGYFGYIKTGKFPFANTGASNNASVLSIVLNKDFSSYYPDISTDLVPKHKPKKIFKSEWEWYEYFDSRNKNYLRNNLSNYLKDCFIKIKFIFFGIYKDGLFPNKIDLTGVTLNQKLILEGQYDRKIRISSIISKIILNLSIILVLINLLSDLKNKSLAKENLYFVIIIGLNLFPHIIAWATSKHLTASINIAFIYLIIFIFKRNKLI